MFSLLPTEICQYSVSDIIRGTLATGNPDKSKKEILIPGLGGGIPIRSARAAIIVALKALNLSPGAKIGVPLYCCPVVFKAIKAADCSPKFLDIDPATFCISPEDLLKKRSEIDAVIAVHMFGNLCDMLKVLEVMNGKAVIEDCAQSIGSKIDGRVTGSFGHISFFSFRSGKYLSVGEGGALFSKNKDLCASISESVSALPAPSRAEEVKHAIMTYMRSKLRSRPLWGLVGSRMWGIYNKRVEFVDKSPISLAQIYLSDLAMVNNRMIYINSQITRQRANAVYYERNLRVDPATLCLEKPGTFYNRYMYPITVPSTGYRDRIREYLQRHGISTSKPYEDVIGGAAKHYGYEGDCPVAEQSLRRALIIPSHYKLKPQEINRIAQCINKGWAEINRKGQKT